MPKTWDKGLRQHTEQRLRLEQRHKRLRRNLHGRSRARSSERVLADAVALDQELVQAETCATQETDASESTSSNSDVYGAGGARLHAGSCDGQMPTVAGADECHHLLDKVVDVTASMQRRRGR